ncbi:MAG TPA: hypothetical protein VGQ28_16505 [Thermoanaerobaculia bacterium]|jgi:hypothetical protein|nr:hypothetical protein [Thermoanaerobaculia bacterium]
MHMKDFHLKFTSKSESGSLFQALRNLSLVDDIKSMFSADGDGIFTEWSPWPPNGVDVPCEA